MRKWATTIIFCPDISYGTFTCICPKHDPAYLHPIWAYALIYSIRSQPHEIASESYPWPFKIHPTMIQERWFIYVFESNIFNPMIHPTSPQHPHNIPIVHSSMKGGPAFASTLEWDRIDRPYPQQKWPIRRFRHDFRRCHPLWILRSCVAWQQRTTAADSMLMSWGG